MTREQAIKRMKKLWGAKAMWRVDERASSPEQRETARETVMELKAERETIQADIKARLDAMDWYVAAQNRLREIAKERDQASYYMSHTKFQIGRNLGWAFHVDASGDTWEECFAKLEKEFARV